MSKPPTSATERRDLEKYIKFLCIKSTQIIVQGRIGKAVSTPCSLSSLKSEWFNLAIKDFPDIDKEAKAAINEGNPNLDRSYVVEISLRTSDSDSLTLEVWSIGFIRKYDESLVRREVYSRISLLLKSLLCVSRIMPAYKLSRKQGTDFVMCYRVYNRKIDLSGLGEGFKTLRVGTVVTPIGTYTMSAAYRTVDNLHVSQQQISPEAVMPFEIHDDHFGVSKPFPIPTAKPCHILRSRVRTLSETSDPGLVMTATESTRNSPHNLYNTSPSQISEDDKAKFVVGTPPYVTTPPRKTSSSPILTRNRIRSPSNPIYDLHYTRQISHSPKNHSLSLKMLNENFPAIAGASAPSRFGQNNPLCKSPGNMDSKTTNSTQTAHHRWDDSKAASIRAGHKIITATSKTPQKFSRTGWSVKPNVMGLNLLANSPPPVCKTGAFVKSNLEDNDAGDVCDNSSNFRFRDLLSAINDEGDGSLENSSRSQSSASDDECDERKKRSSCASQASSSSTCVSSKPSSENLQQQKLSDDYVMVDLNPAFARTDSIEDLGTFYQECKNAPELVMFQEGRGEETHESMLDLTKQLEDYQNEIESFDRFVKEITSG